MRVVPVILLILLFVSCATSTQKDLKSRTIENKFIALTVKNLEKLSVGMTKSQALEAMREGLSDFPEWLLTLNPFRSETLKIKGKTYEVLYYYINIGKREGTADANESVPLVFEKGRLICWDWECLKR
ncbi:MAG: DUF3192 domain-containing protein [Candidatus Omnitrophica bacterium]|jgi:hypothetical protein|nr:DUF3192 domain-containing protein [Candidatus Omnitrophota bacterium]